MLIAFYQDDERYILVQQLEAQSLHGAIHRRSPHLDSLKKRLNIALGVIAVRAPHYGALGVHLIARSIHRSLARWCIEGAAVPARPELHAPVRCTASLSIDMPHSLILSVVWLLMCDGVRICSDLKAENILVRRVERAYEPRVRA